jgi:hypothetical protein
MQALNTARTRLRFTANSPSSSDAGRDEPPSKRARRSSKSGGGAGSFGEGGGGKNSHKGLRHFSVKVCEKVESKGRTTYNEVADELVAEMSKVRRRPAALPPGAACPVSRRPPCGVRAWRAAPGG